MHGSQGAPAQRKRGQRGPRGIARGGRRCEITFTEFFPLNKRLGVNTAWQQKRNQPKRKNAREKKKKTTKKKKFWEKKKYPFLVATGGGRGIFPPARSHVHTPPEMPKLVF